MRRIFITFLLSVGFFVMTTQGQVTFTNQGSMLANIGTTSSADCAVDMNGDGLDDVVRVVSTGIYIDYQTESGFNSVFYPMNIINDPSWSICAADIDGNGYTDLLLGDGNALSFVYANDDGTGYTEDAFPEYIFTQRSTFADIDNDGNLDAFACHDVDQSHPYRNVNGVLELDFDLIQTLDVGGNYAAIWVDYDNDWDTDLYITKCRGGAQPGDPQRINLLYRNNGDGTFTSVGPEANMDDGDQSWATVFEDFDNDGDFDAYTVNHQWANRFMENNGDGTFTDIIETTGIDATDLGAWNCDAADFDNNGFIDIFSEMDNEIYWNNGDGTFTGGQLSFNSGGIGDMNNDGFLDVIAGNSLYLNNGNNNNWVKFDLEGITSNKNGIGARIEIYGAWGVQIREVRAGESFDPASSLIAHFGLGTATAIEQMVVKWPSGVVTTIENPAINQTHSIVEVGCLLDPIAISIDGQTALCPGDLVTLSAPSGTAYAWSNGATEQAIQVTEAGNYSVVVWADTECAALSNNVVVSLITQEEPNIEAQGDLSFCQGGEVILSSSPAMTYMWSNGQTTPSIVVTETGDYQVNIEGACSGVQFQSNVLHVEVLSNALPITNDVIIGEAGNTTLYATGSNLTWYDAAMGGNVVGSGEFFNTPFVDENTTFWVSSQSTYGGGSVTGGKPDNSGSGGLPSTGGRLFFDITDACTLAQVTAYVPVESSAGMRTIELYDNGGNLLNSVVLNCELGENVLNLNFPLSEGSYQIGCAENNLFRNSAGVSYPYTIGEVGSINNSTFGTSYYYYFYDWQVILPSVTCESERVAASVQIIGIDELENPLQIEAYPNPATSFVQLSAPKPINQANVSVYDMNGNLVMTQKITQFNNQQLDVTKWSAGAYRVVISDGKSVSRLDIVVE
jgi:hypothetical protein